MSEAAGGGAGCGVARANGLDGAACVADRGGGEKDLGESSSGHGRDGGAYSSEKFSSSRAPFLACLSVAWANNRGGARDANSSAWKEHP
jgi:hypothetical protein